MREYELYHAAVRKHKYIKKIGNRYFYTQQEIEAYTNGKINDNAVKDVIVKDDVVKDKVEKDKKERRNKAKKASSKHLKKTMNSVKNQISKGKKKAAQWREAQKPRVTIEYTRDDRIV